MADKSATAEDSAPTMSGQSESQPPRPSALLQTSQAL